MTKQCTTCGSHSHYTGQCHTKTYPNYPHQYGYAQTPPCNTTYCDPCGTPKSVCDATNALTAAPARPGMVGSPVFFDECGNPASGYFIKVTDPVSGALKTLYTDPSRVQTIPQPIRLDQQGRGSFFVTGRYIVTLFKPDNCGNLGPAIYTTKTLGGDFDGDFPLNPSPSLDCLPDCASIRVYNKDGCVYPVGLTKPKAIAIQGSVDAGKVAGRWSEVSTYFGCLNAPIPDGTLVLGDTNSLTYQLKEGGNPTIDPESNDGLLNWDLICCSGIGLTTGSFGGGVCVIIESAVDFVYQSRDGAIVDGGPVNNIAGLPPGPLTMNINNIWDLPIAVEIEMVGIGDNDQADLFGEETFVWSLGDEELVTYPDDMSLNNVALSGQSNVQAFAPQQLGPNRSVEIGNSGVYNRTCSATLTIKDIINPSDNKDYFGQWWLYIRNHTANPLGSLYHGTMWARISLTKNATQV